MLRLKIGTAGWDYKDWVGPFYPHGLPRTGWLPYLAERMNIVEVNSTFYAMPNPATVRKWVESTPDDFTFTVKLFQDITHKAELRDCRTLLETFCSTIAPFGSRLEAVCVQLPPYLRASRKSDLETFLGWLPKEMRWAVEFRDPSWFTQDTRDLLTSRDIIWVNSDHYPGLVRTTDTCYVRLLGDHSSISVFDQIQIPRDDELDRLSQEILAMSTNLRTMIVILNNHFEGHSPATWRKLNDRLKALGVEYREIKRIAEQGNLF